tara:strand:+ start:2312 stop:2929 length:618 start_codon:yes stop_codon:yes gene_type:complete
MFTTKFNIRVTDFDGRSRNVDTKSADLDDAIYKDWENFFNNPRGFQDMRIVFKNLEPYIERASDDVFNSGAASDKNFGTWAAKWRDAIGADPDGENLLATGQLRDSFRRMRNRGGAQKTLSYGFTAPYAAEILTDHDWTFNVSANSQTGELEYDEGGTISKSVKVRGRDYLTPVYERVSEVIMNEVINLKWEDIVRKLRRKLNGK